LEATPEGSLERLFESAPAAMLIEDDSGRIVLANAAAGRLLGRDVGELVGRRAEEILPSSERDERGRQSAPRPDGGVLPIEVTVSVVETDQGELTVTALRDISSDLEVERQRENLQTRLMRATGGEAIDAQLGQTGRLETVGQLAGGIAHDFNNILGVIINYSQFVIDELDEDSSVRADVEEIWRAARRGAALTRQLTIFSRHESQTLGSLVLNDVVSDLEELLKRTLGEHIELSTHLGEELWTIEADRGQIEQALVNLALNARDAMPDGGTLTITTENVELNGHEASLYPSIEEGHFVRLSVEDTGVGMDGEVAARAFEPFYTTKAQGEGTGLGLAIVYGIVTGAGGAVALSSEPGRGTVVSAHFPATVARPTAAEGDGMTPARAVSASERVLVVEDDPSMRRMAERILRRAGYEVVTSPGGRDALRKLEAGEGFDMLLTDVVMPEMSGTELAGRAAALYPELRILLMSGYVDRPGVGPVEDGAELLEKPFRAEELLDRVRNVLESEPRAAR
jgi:two-component system cell cycle sensor histidine kinase/response regulator CckA